MSALFEEADLVLDDAILSRGRPREISRVKDEYSHGPTVH
jgi:hypothetical protein